MRGGPGVADLEEAVEKLAAGLVDLREALDELKKAKQELLEAQKELGVEGRKEEEVEDVNRKQKAAMFLVMHSLSGALRYLAPVAALEQEEQEEPEELEEAAVCPTCRGFYDQVAPLPGDARRRKSFGGEEARVLLSPRRSTGNKEGGTVRRGRHLSDAPGAGAPKLLSRNSSNSKLEAGSGTNANPLLPRTLSTSVLRIKQRRSFWEKFVQ